MVSAIAQTTLKIIDNQGDIVFTEDASNVQSILFETVTPPYIPEGSLTSYVYSVGETKKVYFSQGNLQYQASTGTWQFAEHQYDYIGEGNNNVSSTYDGWIDLFAWGTSGWKSGAYEYKPYSTSVYDEQYNPCNSLTTNLESYCSYSDWGVYNSIRNGGNKSNLWRTMGRYEWDYLLFTRSTNLRGLGTVKDIPGLIILPDNWKSPEGVTFEPTSNNCTTNTYTESQWLLMQANGAIFLPAAGSRYNTTADGDKLYGYYWSTTSYSDRKAYSLYFSNSVIISNRELYRSFGYSVRLVQDVK